MNISIDPASMGKAAAGASRRAAFVTASYAPDLERCRLLCETLDRHATGFSHHYLLVAGEDVALFRQLESARRTVVDERDLLPSWLRSFRDPTSLFRRRIWLSLRTRPLRGWHVQQLRRIAIAAHVDEEALVYCDSDVVVLKPFDCASLWRNGDLRLFRRENALLGPVESDQRVWSANAGLVLGIEAPETSPHDYIATFIAWRRSAVTSMCERIQDVAGVHWVQAIGHDRRFSECMIYGRHVDENLRGRGHFLSTEELCRVYWRGPELSDDGFTAFVEAMGPGQVAIGMQSFIGTDIGRIRRLTLGA